ncbi:MAG TPA: NAD(P)-binding domain-containing protein [Candidatus Baltobacteraceae bacterium]|nr:NAD(P)-binding domain-containing protein [Candidatus Baltobacteraceae bacterium]
MRIGIIGSDDRAIAIGRLLASGGHDVTIGDPTDTQRAQAAAQQAQGEAEIPYRQAMTREIVVLAVPHDRIDETLTALGSGIRATAIVDATDGTSNGRTHSEAELLARKLDSHRLVRALIVLPQPGANIPLCGDDPLAKAAVEEALRACKCLTTDRGPLANATELEPRRAA